MTPTEYFTDEEEEEEPVSDERVNHWIEDCKIFTVLLNTCPFTIPVESRLWLIGAMSDI